MYNHEEEAKRRGSCNNLRDRAMIDFLLSTGIRVGELVNQNNVKLSHRKYIS